MAEPRPSATVVVARDSGQGPEFLLVRRRSGDAFGECYTFPGGVLDPDEAAGREFCSGISAAGADRLLGMPSGALDYYSAVVRELFEETGILLGANEPVDDTLRRQLIAGKVAWPSLLSQADLDIPCDDLHYFAHWITPVDRPKRWSTRFFLAAMPAGQDVRPDGNEITDFDWLLAEDALRSDDGGERNLPYPTRKTLEGFAGLGDVASLVAWARDRQAQGIPAIQPEIRIEDGKMRIFMPDLAD